MRKNSIKNTRINMEVQRELSEIIRTEIKDPRVNGAMTSVVAVEERRGLHPQRTCAPRQSAQYPGDHICSGSVHRVWCEHVQTDRRGNQRFKRLRKE